MATLRVTADFSQFPAGTTFGSPYAVEQFMFQDNGSPPSKVTMNGGRPILQFSDAGLQVKLPGPGMRVEVQAAAFAFDFQITAVDRSSGLLLASVMVTGPVFGTYVIFASQSFDTLNIVGGENEGALASLTAEIDVLVG